MTDSQSKTHSAVAFDSPLTPDVLSTDDLFGVLSHQRRRCVLRCLGEHQTPLTLADLADEVTAREQEAPLPDVPAEEVKRVYVSLYHTHIPKLADADLVEYTQERDMVALSTENEHAEALLELATASE